MVSSRCAKKRTSNFSTADLVCCCCLSCPTPRVRRNGIDFEEVNVGCAQTQNKEEKASELSYFSFPVLQIIPPPKELPLHMWNTKSPHKHGQEVFYSSGNSMNYRNRDRKPPRFIPDNFSSLDQVISALRESGLESSNLILGIDFTKSNEWTGRHSFRRRSLHAIGDSPNPYEQAISIIGHTLSSFDEDNLIPCFGFGDASTRDQYVFSFYSDHRPCRGFGEALSRYREIVPHLNLSGPTSFAPVIRASIDIVEKCNGQYHVLVIIADGQVTRNPNVPHGSLSPEEQATVDAIVAASYYPLSIVMVGVGDGPWDAMQHFDDCIPQREFDNFQFVNFTKIMSTDMKMTKKEAAFALAALMEIPFQYRATQGLRPMEKRKEEVGRWKVLPPPQGVIERDNAAMSYINEAGAPSTNYSAPTGQECPICLTNPKNLAFGCGHLTCKDCGATLPTCPICRAPITTRLRLFS